MEYKSINLELKDLSRDKRTAVIKHAVYNNIDRTQDISRKGMFNKSWQENKDDISLYLNHDDNQVPGKPVDFWEDDTGAYTKAYFGTHTLGEDTLKMLDEKIITKASFGYIAQDKAFITHQSKKVRELKQVMHLETSLLTRLQANPLAGVVSVNKSLEQNDIIELKQSIEAMEKFCRNTTATDATIKSILLEIEQAKHIISRYDVSTQPITGQDASSEESKGFAEALYLLTLKTF